MTDFVRLISEEQSVDPDMKTVGVPLGGRIVEIVVTRKCPPGQWFLVAPEVADRILGRRPRGT